ncbi:MAG: recombinase family protein [Oscillospiraceae bacterium]|nr:recombinase family protein [Oscillospiraceae bacterium]
MPKNKNPSINAQRQSNKHAALYIRVSTDAQAEEGYSIDAQSEILKAYCVTMEIHNYQFYIDPGYSGATLDRPQLRELIGDAQSGKLSHVIVYKLDRLSRSQKDTLHLIEDVFNPCGAAFMSVKETLDTSTPMGRLMIGILSAFAQLERENIRERTRMGMLERVKSGLWPGGGRVPFGYDYDTERGVLVPNSDAEAVRRIYSLYLQGYPLYKIAQLVGLGYERQALQILGRRTNCGYIVYNGVEYKGRHEPIIDEETFARAMEMREARSAKRLRASSDHLLTGLVYCGRCGAKMRYQKWGKRGHKLVCYSRDKSKPHLARDPDCTQEMLWADKAEGEVTGALFSFRFDMGEGGARHDGVTALELLNRRYDNTAKKLKRLYNQFGDEGDEVLLETIAAAKSEMKKLSQKIRAEQQQGVLADRMTRIKSDVEGLSSAWGIMTVRERQAVLRELINRVVITGDNIRVEFSF